MPPLVTPLKILLQVFPGIPQAEAQDMVHRGKIHIYPPGTELCREDAVETTFYIILSGKVKVTKVISSEQIRLLKILEPGEFFGEMGLIHDAPRAATVTTLEPTQVLEISKEIFNDILHRSASISLAMAKEVSRRLRENDAMAIEDLRLKAGELASAYQQLAEQEYARREFLSTIAHELRTPLTSANGFLQILSMGLSQEKPIPDGMLKETIQNASRSLQQIIALINDILFLQEMDLILPRFQKIDVKDILQEVIDKNQVRARENNSPIDLEITTDIPTLAGDYRSLERGLSAILDNALKFSPQGGLILLKARLKDEWVEITCQDHGVGVPPDAMPRIFERFFHVDQVGGYMFRGIGLGLPIAKFIIEQHQGKISLESNLNKGTKVIILLPAKDVPELSGKED